MNKYVRQNLNYVATYLGQISTDFINAISSILRIIVLSRLNVAFITRNYYKLRKNDRCILLANGPSLKQSLIDGIMDANNSDIIGVNSFVQADAFWNCKPRFYYILDGAFFDPFDERTRAQVEKIKSSFERVSWDMYLCIPSSCVKGGILNGLNNPNIKVIRWNTTSIDGSCLFRHFIYGAFLGMPKCTNITNFAIMASVLIRYNTIYLYGVDHSMFKGLYVDEDNTLCYTDSHVYDVSPVLRKIPGRSIADELKGNVECFKSHTQINEYAIKKGVKIINYTKESYIDAYERYKK